MISYECVICGADGILGEDLRMHLEGHHETSSWCESCLVDISDMTDHIFDKHHHVRRMKKSYTKIDNAPEVHAAEIGPVSLDIPPEKIVKFALKSNPHQISNSTFHNDDDFLNDVPSISKSHLQTKPLPTQRAGLIIAVKSKPPPVLDNDEEDDPPFGFDTDKLEDEELNLSMMQLTDTPVKVR